MKKTIFVGRKTKKNKKYYYGVRLQNSQLAEFGFMPDDTAISFLPFASLITGKKWM